MSIFPRRKKRAGQLHQQRQLRAEALESRALLSAVAPLPCSVVLPGQSSNAEPPDPCIQFSPQPMVTAAVGNAAVHWQGHFTERLVESPLGPTASAAPAAWLVNVVFNLNGQPVPAAAASTWAYDLSGTARETLTPLSAAGTQIASGQIWVSNEQISEHIVVLPGVQASPVANSFSFTTDTNVTQTLTLLAATAVAPTTSPVWIGNTTSDTTGLVTSPLSNAGMLSFRQQITQTLAPVSATVSASLPWTVSAEFDAAGSFKELSPIAASTTASVPSGNLSLTGTLTGSISPPAGLGIPTQLVNNTVSASVTFGPIVTPTPVPILSSTPLSANTVDASPASPVDPSPASPVFRQVQWRTAPRPRRIRR